MQLRVGTRIDAEGPGLVTASKMNRHTFWCGQSGSGKTYALGVLLEQVLLHTRLPLVILDPNSDFVRFSELRADASEADAAELRSRSVRVLRPHTAEDPLKVRFLSMPLISRAALLQIDPLRDADEFNAMIKMEPEVLAGLQEPLADWLRASGNPVHRKIAVRLENLGLADLDLWAGRHRSVTEFIDDRADATVVDLGGFSTPLEPKATALAVLDHLWERRADRIGRLIVIDEAHNLCPPDPVTAVDTLLTERIVQIAAEGRKYGLWLLMSTQRPSKVHPNALSQCDNLGLMKLSSPSDLAELARVFGYAPAELLSRVTGFSQGQALFAGGFVAEPQVVQMRDRLTLEGGSDVAIELRDHVARGLPD